ncbi:hypothetical protein ACFLTN_07380 [Chloroflexota bacterium]
MRLTWFVAALVAVLAFVPAAALAHSPQFPEGNHSLETAYQINYAAKSWAIYTALEHPDKGDYYKLTVSSGDKIQVSLITPDNPSKSGFMPSFALLIPGLTQKDSVPTYIEVPAGYGAIVVNGTNPQEATYEAFSPGWFYEVAKLTMNAPADGIYYIVVFDNAHKTGNYGLPVGYIEEFTPTEWVMIPYNVHVTYTWEGQNQFVTLLPIILVLIIGGIIFYWRNKKGMAPKGISKWLAAFAGLMFLGTAASIIYQMLLTFSVTGATGEAVFTFLFVTISTLLGTVTLLYAVRNKPALTLWRRVALFAMGVIALFVWSGLYLGPALAILAALVPPYAIKKG